MVYGLWKYTGIGSISAIAFKHDITIFTSSQIFFNGNRMTSRYDIRGFEYSPPYFTHIFDMFYMSFKLFCILANYQNIDRPFVDMHMFYALSYCAPHIKLFHWKEIFYTPLWQCYSSRYPTKEVARKYDV